MPRKLNLDTLASQFRVQLKMRGLLSAAEAMAFLQISQASFSRLTIRMREDLVVQGRTQKVRYALRRALDGIGGEIPLFCISSDGRLHTVGQLIAVEPSGFLLSKENAPTSYVFFDDIPYFLEDMRPSGFLGRRIPTLHSELRLPNDLLRWSQSDCLRYWVNAGWDLPGNMIVGQKALDLFLAHQQQEQSPAQSQQRSEQFTLLAQQVLEEGSPGSSAGGEQPKFLIPASRSRSAELVKFSPVRDTVVNRRIADLLVCEHLCLQVLNAHGHSAAQSNLHIIDDCVFLEIERFDRVGLRGRKAVISLRTLRMELAGTLESWVSIGKELLKNKHISLAHFEIIVLLENFGRLIGNTDMHAGNFSFFIDENFQIECPTPCYDMLPMMYSPIQNQIIERTLVLSHPRPSDKNVWLQAASLALAFWRTVASNSLVSTEFQLIARGNAQKIESLQQLVSEVL